MGKPAVGEVLAGVGHDLRSPLTAILLQAERALHDEPPARLVTQLQRIVRVAERMNRMLDDLLDGHAFTLGRTAPLPMQPVELAEALKASIEQAQEQLGERFVASVPTTLRGVWHAASLARAVDNLLSNAQKYADRAGPIELTATRARGLVRIAVSNTGPPQSKAALARLFRPFERASPAAARGWGLGLTLVAGIARLHGGRALAEHAGGRTTFVIWLPVDSSLALSKRPLGLARQPRIRRRRRRATAGSKGDR